MALPFKGFLFFTAGHSLTTFELTITRLASKVRKIVKDKIHDEEDSEEDDDGDSEEEDSSDEKWKLRRRRRKRRKRKLLHESSSDYESEESEGPDTISSSSEDESHSKRKLQLLRHFRKTYFNPFWKVELHNRHKLFKPSILCLIDISKSDMTHFEMILPFVPFEGHDIHLIHCLRELH